MQTQRVNRRTLVADDGKPFYSAVCRTPVLVKDDVGRAGPKTTTAANSMASEQKEESATRGLCKYADMVPMYIAFF